MSHIKSKILQLVPQDPRDEPASELLAREASKLKMARGRSTRRKRQLC